jgi:hypothetical protein
MSGPAISFDWSMKTTETEFTIPINHDDVIRACTFGFGLDFSCSTLPILSSSSRFAANGNIFGTTSIPYNFMTCVNEWQSVVVTMGAPSLKTILRKDRTTSSIVQSHSSTSTTSICATFGSHSDNVVMKSSTAGHFATALRAFRSSFASDSLLFSLTVRLSMTADISNMLLNTNLDADIAMSE